MNRPDRTKPIPEVPPELYAGEHPEVGKLSPTNICQYRVAGGASAPEPPPVDSADPFGPGEEEECPFEAPSPLIDRAYAMRYDPANKPPKEEVLMTLGKAPIASNGNVTGLQGKEKVGKTSVVSAILGAALRGNYSVAKNPDKPWLGDCLGFEWEAKVDRGTVIHFDTEQSPADWHAAATRAICRSSNPRCVPRFLSIPLVQFSFLERKEIIEQAMAREFEAGGVALVILDGVADFCKSPNDEEEAIELVRFLMALAHRFDTAILCVLHENPGTDQGKTRGHLGSELTRKAFANVKVEKDDGVSIIYGDKMRKKDIPKSQGFCFQWSDEAHMHVSIGTAGQLKAVEIEAKNDEKRAKAVAAAEAVFGSEPALEYSVLVERIMVADDIKIRGAETRVKTWKTSKIIVKNDNGTYSLNPQN